MKTVPSPDWIPAFLAYFVGGLLMVVHVVGYSLGLWEARAITWWAALGFLLVLVILALRRTLAE